MSTPIEYVSPVGATTRLIIDLGAIAENWRRLDAIAGPAVTGAAVHQM